MENNIFNILGFVCVFLSVLFSVAYLTSKSKSKKLIVGIDNYEILMKKNKMLDNFQPNLKEINKNYEFFKKNIWTLRNKLEIIDIENDESGRVYLHIIEGDYYVFENDHLEDKMIMEVFLLLSLAGQWPVSKKVCILVERISISYWKFEICCNCDGWGDLFHEPSPSLELVS